MGQNQVPSASSFRQFPSYFTCICKTLSQCQLVLRMQLITVLRKAKLTVKRKQKVQGHVSAGF